MLALSLSSSFKFSWRAPKDIIFKSECVMHVHLLKVIKVVDFGTNQKGVCEFQQLWSYLTPFLRHGDLLAENCEFFLPHSHLTPSLGVNPFEFLDETYRAKTRWMGLLYGENCMILTSAVFARITRVTDSRTDRRICDSIYARLACCRAQKWNRTKES